MLVSLNSILICLLIEYIINLCLVVWIVLSVKIKVFKLELFIKVIFLKFIIIILVLVLICLLIFWWNEVVLVLFIILEGLIYLIIRLFIFFRSYKF